MTKGWAFASGILVGTAGLSVLTSKLVMKGYKYIFAGAMIARDRIRQRKGTGRRQQHQRRREGDRRALL